jgi:apolipoprotein N-acyltransferase
MPKPISLCVLAAVLLALPYLFPLLFPLAWVAFVPLFWVIERAETLRHAAFYGWLMGLLAHLIGFYWLVFTISVFGGFAYPISAVVFFIYGSLQGLQLALLALLVKRFGFGPFQLFPALFWVAVEFWFPMLFPWYLANSQSFFTSFIQTADLVGPYGASLLLMWFNTTAYNATLANQAQPMRREVMAIVISLVVVSVIYGVVRRDAVAEKMAAASKLSVVAVQGNIDIDLKWNPARVKSNMEAYRNLTRPNDGARLVIWPESAIEVWLPENLQELPRELMPALGPGVDYFIFGARSFRGTPGAADFRAFNTAYLTDATGGVRGRYHKQVLLAFGEYLPFSRILSKLPAIPFADGFTPGDGPHTFDLSGGVRIAPLICYEDLMPPLSRAFVKDTRANVLVNLTNDAWYGRTVAPWQHTRLAQWRAIETRRSLLRVTNTGITTLINAKGEIQESLPIFTPAVLKTQLEILEGETFYVRFGDGFAWAVSLLAIALVLSKLASRRAPAA